MKPGFVCIVAGAAIGLSACADFMEGMDRGASRQEAYLARQADPFGTYVADLPASPAPSANVPITVFYRCSDGKRSHDYAFQDGEWYQKGWRDSEWTPLACGKGAHRTTSFSHASSTCGSNGRVFWLWRDFQTRDSWFQIEQKIDIEDLVYRSTQDLGKGEKTIQQDCEEIDVKNRQVRSNKPRR